MNLIFIFIFKVADGGIKHSTKLRNEQNTKTEKEADESKVDPKEESEELKKESEESVVVSKEESEEPKKENEESIVVSKEESEESKKESDESVVVSKEESTLAGSLTAEYLFSLGAECFQKYVGVY